MYLRIGYHSTLPYQITDENYRRLEADLKDLYKHKEEVEEDNNHIVYSKRGLKEGYFPDNHLETNSSPTPTFQKRDPLSGFEDEYDFHD